MNSARAKSIIIKSVEGLHDCVANTLIFTIIVGLALLPIMLSACAALPRDSFTASDEASATPPGFNHVRWSGDDAAFGEVLRTILRPGSDGTLNALAISGGGANGAYGAGLLTAWSRQGGRREFRLVTGISTGASSAPFAFLGPTWDGKLSHAYLGGDLQRLL